jgi:transketolase
MSVGYNRANVRIVGTHAGIAIGEDGYSQMATEDIACMRSIPNMAVVQPADAVETERAVEYLVRHRGPVFLRLTRQKLEDVNPPDYRFEFGRGVILKEGGDVTLVATGGVVWEALKAAEALAGRGFAARVVNIHTIKPLDEDVILDSLRRTRGIVTVEDHGIHGGLGSAVAEAAAQAAAGFVRRIGVRDFAESGDPAGLYRKYGLSAEHIVAEAEKLLR